MMHSATGILRCRPSRLNELIECLYIELVVLDSLESEYIASTHERMADRTVGRDLVIYAQIALTAIRPKTPYRQPQTSIT